MELTVASMNTYFISQAKFGWEKRCTSNVGMPFSKESKIKKEADIDSYKAHPGNEINPLKRKTRE